MNEKLKQLEDHNTSLAGKMDEMERHIKLSNLIIHGIPLSSPSTLNDESTVTQMNQRSQRETDLSLTTAVVQLCQKKLILSITEWDISTIHHLPSWRTTRMVPS